MTCSVGYEQRTTVRLYNRLACSWPLLVRLWLTIWLYFETTVLTERTMYGLELCIAYSLSIANIIALNSNALRLT